MEIFTVTAPLALHTAYFSFDKPSTGLSRLHHHIMPLHTYMGYFHQFQNMPAAKLLGLECKKMEREKSIEMVTKMVIRV